MQSVADLPLWSSWPERLPTRPLCADAFADGACRLPRGAALGHQHVEFNAAGRLAWLNFDLDTRDSFEAWDRANLPAPNAYVQNPSNGHGHALYAIATPIGLTGLSREKPIALAADVQRGMTRRLGADPAYTNRFAKNPMSPRWRTGWFATKPYDLRYLLDALDRRDLRPTPRQSEVAGISRNIDLFDGLRQFAYRHVREAKRAGTLDLWLRRLGFEAALINAQFATPLSFAELRQIARSVGKWTWHRFSDARFSRIQAARSRRRWNGHVAVSTTKPWKAEGISRATWYRRREQ